MKNPKIKEEEYLNLQDAVAITSVAEIFETKVSFSFWKLVSEGLLELGTRCTHETINQIPILLYSAFILCFFSVALQIQQIL